MAFNPFEKRGGYGAQRWRVPVLIGAREVVVVAALRFKLERKLLLYSWLRSVLLEWD